MTTRIHKGFKGVASLAAAGLLSVLGLTSANAAGLQTATWLGQMEVTAPVTIANLGAMTVTATRHVGSAVANLGSMTVTATAEPDARFADHAKAAASTGESAEPAARTPRAVLVQ